MKKALSRLWQLRSHPRGTEGHSLHHGVGDLGDHLARDPDALCSGYFEAVGRSRQHTHSPTSWRAFLPTTSTDSGCGEIGTVPPLAGNGSVLGHVHFRHRLSPCITASLAQSFANAHHLQHLARTVLVIGANVAAFGILWLLKFLILNRLFKEIADVEVGVEV